MAEKLRASPDGRRANPVPAPPMTRVATLPRLIAVRLLWYAAVGAVALLAFKLHTQFGADVLLTAIAAYVPLSCRSCPSWPGCAVAARESGRADAQAAPGWPGYLAAATGIVMLAGYHVAAAPYLAECGILLLLVAADLWLVRKVGVLPGPRRLTFLSRPDLSRRFRRRARRLCSATPCTRASVGRDVRP